MKKLILIFVLALFSLKLSAQFSEKNFIYLSGGLNLGNFLGGNLNVTYILNNNDSFQAGISGLLRSPKSKPDDFTSGLTGFFTLGLADLMYLDEMNTFYLLYGKIFKSGRSSTIRFNIAGGIGYTNLTEATNWTRVTDYSFGSQNYTYDLVHHGSTSVIINPKVEFPFTRHFGLALSPVLQFNKDRIYIGIGIELMLGVLRAKKKTG